LSVKECNKTTKSPGIAGAFLFDLHKVSGFEHISIKLIRNDALSFCFVEFSNAQPPEMLPGI